MSEEEKNAIEKFERLYLKDFNNESITNDDRLSYIECTLISNLIEKQQKEIEELKAINNMQKYRIEVIDERELIPKSKIKEKIKEELEESKFLKDIDNFDGSKENQKYYYDGYRDCALSFKELLKEE